MRQILLALTLATAPMAAGAQVASADQSGADAAARAGAALEGQPVLGAKGIVLGYVERVTSTPDGKPGQLLVRPKGMAAGGPRSIAFAAVEVSGKAVRTPLTRAEFAAMPAVDAAR